ncbi:swr complex subunit [Extremus antarcticus]|uniref:SWR1-complex protein 5 n=1 Tax=Extremus antarcticus TaxID=702011 RepID=A0AAJ0GHB1_9PEZI|nr:swr complex subunit [Extremus antarcticus]
MAHQIQDVDAEPEETYDENADEDFNPEADNDGPDNETSASSDDEDTTTTKAAAKPTKKRNAAKADLDADLDSGDEATIQAHKPKKRKRKHGKHIGAQDAHASNDDDSAGEGGLIKTRAQRLAEKVERKQRKYATVGEVTIDVDAVWAGLSGLGVGRPSANTLAKQDQEGEEGEEGVEGAVQANKENFAANAALSTPKPSDEEEMIEITRLITYAGETTEITERVPRSSKAAQQYLATDPASTTNPDHPPFLRPLKRPSLFEPNPSGLVKNVPPSHLRPRAPSRLDVLQAEKRVAEETKKKAERMTTVQKSALDWRGFVEGEEGLKGELEKYGKSGRGYLEREDFLGRVDLAREGARRGGVGRV